MLDTATKEQLVSILASSLAVNSIVSAASGLNIQLAANCSYYIHLMSSAECDGDGMQYRLQYSGTNGLQGMSYIEAPSLAMGPFALNASYTFPINTTVFTVQGVFTTGRAGRLSLEVRKDTNTGGPSVIAAGSHLVARRI